MIRINVQDEKTLALNKLISDFVNTQRSKSFSERHPELGRKINCIICGYRHYASRTTICKPVYATHDRHGNPYYEDESPMIAPLPDQSQDGMAMRNAIIGRAAFAKKRMRPHRHPRDLEILHNTNILYDEMLKFQENDSSGSLYQLDITTCVRAAEAIERNRFHKQRRMKRRQQDVSRRINAGLAVAGTRP